MLHRCDAPTGTSCHSCCMRGPSFTASYSSAPVGQSRAADALLKARCPTVMRVSLQALAAAAGNPSLDGGSPGKGAAGIHSGALGPPLLRRPCVHVPGPHRRLCHKGENSMMQGPPADAHTSSIRQKSGDSSVAAPVLLQRHPAQHL